MGDISLFGFNKTATPARLVEDALAGFKKAEEDLIKAQEAISAQKEEYELKLKAAAEGVADCTEQNARLARVRDRIKDFLA